MPLTAKGKKVLANMKEEYGGEKGERVFWASVEKGTLKGVHKMVGKKGGTRRK